MSRKKSQDDLTNGFAKAAFSRRGFLIGASAFALSGCVSTVPEPSQPV
ncbi:MAG: L,D-transpeptidase, partial [Brucella intermedia]